MSAAGLTVGLDNQWIIQQSDRWFMQRSTSSLALSSVSFVCCYKLYYDMSSTFSFIVKHINMK